MQTKTPNGKNCIAPGLESRFNAIAKAEVKGVFQDLFLSDIAFYGFTQLPNMGIKGKAANYRSKYMRSAINFVDRVNKALENTSCPYRIKSGTIGPKGGFGYYID